MLRSHPIVSSSGVQLGTTGARMPQSVVTMLSAYQHQDMETYVNVPNTPEDDVTNPGVRLPYLIFVRILGSRIPSRRAW